MFNKITVRLGIFSSLVTLAILIMLPRIPISVNNQILQLNTFIGGYQFPIKNGTEAIDLLNYKKGFDFTGGIYFNISAENSEEELNLEEAKIFLEERLSYLKVTDYSLNEGDSYLQLKLPETSQMINEVSMLIQPGEFIFKTLVPTAEWDIANIEEFYYDTNSWEYSSLEDLDLEGLIVSNVTNENGQAVPQLVLRFSPAGRIKFTNIAKSNVGKPMAIYVDSGMYPIAMPVFTEEVAQEGFGDPIISGNFDPNLGKYLQMYKETSTMPQSLTVIENERFSPSFGEDLILKAYYGVFISLVILLVFFVIRFRLFGLYSFLQFLISIIFELAFIKLFNVVLNVESLIGILFGLFIVLANIYLVSVILRNKSKKNIPSELAIAQSFKLFKKTYVLPNVYLLMVLLVATQYLPILFKGAILSVFFAVLISLFSILMLETFLEAFYAKR